MENNNKNLDATAAGEEILEQPFDISSLQQQQTDNFPQLSWFFPPFVTATTTTTDMNAHNRPLLDDEAMLLGDYDDDGML